MSVIQILEIDSSQLRSADDAALAVHAIYRELRLQRRVIAVVASAPGAAAEQHAVVLLARALDEAGVPHEVVTSPEPDLSADTAQSSLREAPVRVVTRSRTHVESQNRTEPLFASQRGNRSVPFRPLRVVLLGLGTVGLGVFRHLAARPDQFDVRRVVVRNPAKHRNDGVPADRLSTNLWHAVNEPADAVIELIGGIAPAADVVHAALLRGRTVITANKALIAARWDIFERYARPHAKLRFSAAVGGALPVLETIASVARANAIARVRAVINGTCNFVLDEVASGVSLADAVRLAQRHGFAEADPHADLSGADAAQKLCLIARAAFGVACSPSSVECGGIEHLTADAVAAAAARGFRVRLVATCFIEHGAIRACARAEELDPSDYLAGARREENRVEITTTDGTTLRLSGKGAGRWPTALSVMGDVFDCLGSRVLSTSLFARRTSAHQSFRAARHSSSPTRSSSEPLASD